MTKPEFWNEMITDHDELAKHLREIGINIPIFELATQSSGFEVEEPSWVTNYFYPRDAF